MCNLSWSKNVNEIVSTHGYSQNQIIVWKHPTMTKLATLTGHTLRVLYLAVSPDGQTIVTGAGEAPHCCLGAFCSYVILLSWYLITSVCYFLNSYFEATELYMLMIVRYKSGTTLSCSWYLVT